jgi:hypothetical protein
MLEKTRSYNLQSFSIINNTFNYNSAQMSGSVVRINGLPDFDPNSKESRYNSCK